MCSYARKLVYPCQEQKTALDATETLTCLGDNQYRFLLLLARGNDDGARGNDDGTGAVFADLGIPMVETDV